MCVCVCVCLNWIWYVLKFADAGFQDATCFQMIMFETI